jgi:predicted nucleotidyltransferase
MAAVRHGLRDGIEKMALPAEEMAARAAVWAEAEAAVRAAIVYGSVAQGTANEGSDLDLIVVAEPGQRDALWARRAQISAVLLGRDPAWWQEPHWQRSYRYQSWDENLTELDLTFDEEYAAPWAALAKGFRAIADKAGVETRLRYDLAEWRPSEFDAPAFDGGTWAWLNYLHGKLRHGETWFVRYGVMDTLNNRVVPLLGSAGHSAHRDMDPADVALLHEAAPSSPEPAELRRSLRATADLYSLALDRWSQRTGHPRPRNPLAAVVLASLRQAASGDHSE